MAPKLLGLGPKLFEVADPLWGILGFSAALAPKRTTFLSLQGLGPKFYEAFIAGAWPLNFWGLALNFHMCGKPLFFEVFGPQGMHRLALNFGTL